MVKVGGLALMQTHIKVEGHTGTWAVIDTAQYPTGKLFLLESEQFGEDAPSIICNENGKLIMDEIYNGFDDYEEVQELRGLGL
jgi:hypothetical protein